MEKFIMGLEIVIDPITGVNYFVYRDPTNFTRLGGLCPRFNKDGTLYVSDIKPKNKEDTI